MITNNNKLLIFAFIPRSGSNYLCDLILRVGGFGIPLEYYYPYDFQSRRNYYNKPLKPIEFIDKCTVNNEIEWFNEILRRRSLKCSWDAHVQFRKEIGDLFYDLDVQYIYIKRKDKLRQAISWYRAEYGNRWTSNTKKTKDPQYSRNLLDKYLNYIHHQESEWEFYLRYFKHLQIFYEDISYDTIRLIEKFTGLARNDDSEVKSDYEITRDDLTEEWVVRYTDGV
jgi:LPS sulfotransferase NodH